MPNTLPPSSPSMSQDMQKGRRTEIEPLNGFVVDDPKHITELRLNRAAPLQSLPPLPGRRRVYLRAQAGLPRPQDNACLRPKSRSLQLDIDRKIESCGRCNSSHGTSKRQSEKWSPRKSTLIASGPARSLKVCIPDLKATPGSELH
ncbi:ketopantoate reductase C-terminal domain-containing protein [Bradyrhizobium sp. USDA 3650]